MLHEVAASRELVWGDLLQTVDDSWNKAASFPFVLPQHHILRLQLLRWLQNHHNDTIPS